MNLRMIGLSAAVVCAALVPLVASAGSLGPSLDSLGSLGSSGPGAVTGTATAPVRAPAPDTADAGSRTDARPPPARAREGGEGGVQTVLRFDRPGSGDQSGPIAARGLRTVVG
ncbi:hypothetical protein ACFXPP_30630, partial [Streptomyces sp. NPDC059134]